MTTDTKIDKNVIPPLQPPPPMHNEKSLSGIIKYVEKILGGYLTDAYKHHFLLWNRTGGYSGHNYLSSDSITLTNSPSKEIMETDLLSYTVPANNLDKDGDYVEIDAFGMFAGNSNHKRVKLYFGSNIILDTDNLVAENSWKMTGQVYRVDSNTQKAVTTFFYEGIVIVITKTFPNSDGEKLQDMGSGIVIKVTGTSDEASDIIQNGLIVKTSK